MAPRANVAPRPKPAKEQGGLARKGDFVIATDFSVSDFVGDLPQGWGGRPADLGYHETAFRQKLLNRSDPSRD